VARRTRVSKCLTNEGVLLEAVSTRYSIPVVVFLPSTSSTGETHTCRRRCTCLRDIRQLNSEHGIDIVLAINFLAAHSGNFTSHCFPPLTQNAHAGRSTPQSQHQRQHSRKENNCSLQNSVTLPLCWHGATGLLRDLYLRHIFVVQDDTEYNPGNFWVCVCVFERHRLLHRDVP
jgi:hypothetical protein